MSGALILIGRVTSMRTDAQRLRERKWYADNRAAILIRKKEWRQKNKDVVSVHNRTHYIKHPDFHRARREARNLEPAKWRKYGRDRYAMKREELIAYGKEWRTKNEAKYRRSYRQSRLKKKYGITIEQYEAMAAKQGGKCLACGEVPKGKAHAARLHLDHCHASGRLRGMLCYQCNLALGLVKDNIQILEGLIAHLKRTSHA